MLIHLNQHRIILDRWTCNSAYHFLSLIIKIMLYTRRKLFVMLKVSKYLGSCPEHELTKHHTTLFLMQITQWLYFPYLYWFIARSMSA